MLQAALLGAWLRVIYLSNTVWRWASRDAARGVRDVGVGLVRMPRTPSAGLATAGWGLFDLVSGAVFGVLSMIPQVVGVFRPLTVPEVSVGRRVYGETIPWSRVRIFQGSYVARVASRFSGRPTAVVTMRVIHVPSSFDTSTTRGKAWLVHELMHVWQGQHTGPSSMARALLGQARRGYDYGGGDGLRAGADRGLAAFNPEQQADIMRDYHRRLASGGDLAPFRPYVRQVLGVGGDAPDD
jgi:hypothetical protein